VSEFIRRIEKKIMKKILKLVLVILVAFILIFTIFIVVGIFVLGDRTKHIDKIENVNYEKNN